MLQSIGYGTYVLFGLLTSLGACFIWFFVPETKRLTLEEMVRSQLFSVKYMAYMTIGCDFRLRGNCCC